MRRLPLALPAWVVAAALGGAGCSSLPVVEEIKTCSSDDQCAAGEICFPEDGCGDPGSNLAVEVVPAGQYPQDFPVGGLEATQNLQLAGAAAVTGTMTVADDPPTALSSRVFMTLTGESLVLPGISRHYQAQVTPSAGAYSVPVATGRYKVSAIPIDPNVPPVATAEVTVAAGEQATLDFEFPSHLDRRALNGVIKSASGALIGAALSIQALDPATHLPLSGAVAVQPSDGSFSLILNPGAVALEHFALEVRPTEPGQLIPVQRFSASASALLAPLLLSFSDPGSPVTVSGRALTAGGEPLADAVVYVDEVVQGGGHLQTPSVRTAADGSFTLAALPTDSAGGASLWILPGPTSPSGTLQTNLSLSAPAATLGQVVCPARPLVTGRVKRSDGTVFAGARVVAVALWNDGSRPLPEQGAEATTASDGTFTIALEPASYRLDILPGEKLPRTSRYVTVDPDVSANGTPSQKAIPDVVLSNGRTLKGAVSLFPTPNSSDQQPAPLAAVKFYRVVQVNGLETSMPLAEGLADSNAQYTVTLPVH